MSSTTWVLSTATDAAADLELFPLLLRYERGLIPLKEAEPDPDAPGRFTVGLGDDLAMLLTKVSPGLGTEQADAWIKVMVTALSDLPGRVSREAAQTALHRPMNFANEIETEVRKLAAGLMARHMLACSRLRQMAVEQDRRRNMLAAPIETATPEEIRRMSPEMRNIGIRCGGLTQEQVDQALASAPPDQQAA